VPDAPETVWVRYLGYSDVFILDEDTELLPLGDPAEVDSELADDLLRNPHDRFEVVGEEEVEEILAKREAEARKAAADAEREAAREEKLIAQLAADAEAREGYYGAETQEAADEAVAEARKGASAA